MDLGQHGQTRPGYRSPQSRIAINGHVVFGSDNFRSPIPGSLDVGGLGAADRADHPGMYAGGLGGQALSAWQGAGVPEAGERAGLEAGHGANAGFTQRISPQSGWVGR
jgi:hypothetical protein